MFKVNTIFIWSAIIINVTVMLCISTVELNSFSDYALVGLALALINILCLLAHKAIKEDKKEDKKDEL